MTSLERLKKFISKNISSVEHLEIVRFLLSHGENSYSADEIGRKLRRSNISVAQSLEHLHSRGLIEINEKGPLKYKFDFERCKDREIIKMLISEYDVKPHAVLRLIYPEV